MISSNTLRHIFLSGLLVAPLAWTTGCGSPADQETPEPGSDSIIIGKPDAIWIGGDTLIPDRDVLSPDGMEEDSLSDGRTDGNGPRDSWTDLPFDGSPDRTVPDTLQPDLAEIWNPPDVPPDVAPQLCGGIKCPADLPMCVDDQCVCTNYSCPDGTYCSNRLCVPCDQDSRCGSDCVSCASQGLYCSQDGSQCVGCDEAHPCPTYHRCIESFCESCADAGLCGPSCFLCSGQTPLCANDQCVCSSASCPPEHACNGQTCVACTATNPSYCGPSCQVCSGSTPHCFGGQCQLCNLDTQCGASCSPCTAPKPLCKPDGSGCAQCLANEHCPANEHCSNFACVPNCTAQGCQSDTSKSRKKCGEEWTVGRIPAQSSVAWDGETSSTQGNNDDIGTFLDGGPTKCWDASYDHFYRIWLRPGDHVTVHMKNKASLFDAMLKFYSGPTKCHIGSGMGDDNLVDCYNGGGDGKDEQFAHTATKEGWHYIVVDGRRSFTEDADWGAYRLTVTLTCAEPGCCCNP